MHVVGWKERIKNMCTKTQEFIIRNDIYVKPYYINTMNDLFQFEVNFLDLCFASLCV